jgi:hypothetical protein
MCYHETQINIDDSYGSTKGHINSYTKKRSNPSP